MASREIPEYADRCPECRGRGMYFDRSSLYLGKCDRCDGYGWLMEISDEEFDFLLESTGASE